MKIILTNYTGETTGKLIIKDLSFKNKLRFILGQPLLDVKIKIKAKKAVINGRRK